MDQPRESRTTLRRISDLNLAAFLLAKGHNLVRFQGGPRAEFVFSDVPEQAILAYYGQGDEVSARKLLDALKNLKGLLQGLR